MLQRQEFDSLDRIKRSPLITRNRRSSLSDYSADYGRAVLITLRDSGRFFGSQFGYRCGICRDAADLVPQCTYLFH